MLILIAASDHTSRLALEALLAKQGHQVLVTADGKQAWQAFQTDQPPKLAILEWNMPELDGLQLCRQIRATPNLKSTYLILLTCQKAKKHIIEGLGAGANDYIAMPFDHEELDVRVFVGTQMVQLQTELAQRVADVEEALAKVKQLQGLLPICTYCKSIRDDQDYWHRVEHYIGSHSEAQFSHGICPECWKTVVEPELRKAGLPTPSKKA